MCFTGISDAHELGRVFTNADKNCFEDFGVSFLSPIMTFTERPIRSLNIRDEVGYIEIQIRKMLQVPAHKSTRLWVGIPPPTNPEEQIAKLQSLYATALNTTMCLACRSGRRIRSLSSSRYWTAPSLCRCTRRSCGVT